MGRRRADWTRERRFWMSVLLKETLVLRKPEERKGRVGASYISEVMAWAVFAPW